MDSSFLLCGTVRGHNGSVEADLRQEPLTPRPFLPAASAVLPQREHADGSPSLPASQGPCHTWSAGTRHGLARGEPRRGVSRCPCGAAPRPALQSCSGKASAHKRGRRAGADSRPRPTNAAGDLPFRYEGCHILHHPTRGRDVMAVAASWWGAQCDLRGSTLSTDIHTSMTSRLPVRMRSHPTSINPTPPIARKVRL